MAARSATNHASCDAVIVGDGVLGDVVGDALGCVPGNDELGGALVGAFEFGAPTAAGADAGDTLTEGFCASFGGLTAAGLAEGSNGGVMTGAGACGATEGTGAGAGVADVAGAVDVAGVADVAGAVEVAGAVAGVAAGTGSAVGTDTGTGSDTAAGAGKTWGSEFGGDARSGSTACGAGDGVGKTGVGIAAGAGAEGVLPGGGVPNFNGL